MIARLALLLALTSVAAADPRAGRQTLEVDAGAAVFDLHAANGGVDPAMAFRLAIGRYWSDRFALGLHFVDHVLINDAGATRQLDNALTLVLVGQYWVRPTIFVELGGGVTDPTAWDSVDALPLDGWTVAARGGVLLDANLVLSAHLLHTWVRGEPASTDAVAVLFGWMM